MDFDKPASLGLVVFKALEFTHHPCRQRLIDIQP
jgi:hypothetical protein